LVGRLFFGGMGQSDQQVNAYLPQLDSVWPDRVLKSCKSRLHLQDLEREGFAEAIFLLRRLPVGEFHQGAGCVLDDDVLDSFLEAICPGKPLKPSPKSCMAGK
jgi:hypothetical protein